MQLKKKTDRALDLLHEIKNVQFDENKMKPRELKALAQVQSWLMWDVTVLPVFSIMHKI